MRTHYGVERLMPVAPATVYHCIADYREHHRPGGFLPPAFEQLEITRGGVGAGTEYRFVMILGGKRRVVHTRVSEPVPGHTLVETSPGIETTFTVDPIPYGARVRFDTVLDEPGLQGILTRMFAPRMLASIYEDELLRLEEYAAAHPEPVAGRQTA